MKRFFVFIFLLAIVGFVVGFEFRTSQNKAVESAHTQQAISTTPAPTSIPIGNPTRLQIPKIGVDAPVEEVGLDTNKNMDVPRVPTDTGWYDLGPKPGQQGSAVIDGHLDLVDGSPSVFWNLKNLSSGDQIVVTDSNGKTYTFSVSQAVSYPYNNIPLQTIFANTSGKKLNLITCGGTWDQASHNYSNRIVVYSDLKQ